MTEITNLRRVRKQKARAEAETHAANNRAAHGRTKAEKRAAEAVRDLAQRRLDQHKRSPDAE